MFDWFKKRDYSNVIQFPEVKTPYVDPPERETPAVTYYRLGLTNNSRVSLQMGYSEITMNVAGIDNLIKQLECFRDQIIECEIDDEQD
jgi:hypothetical protein